MLYANSLNFCRLVLFILFSFIPPFSENSTTSSTVMSTSVSDPTTGMNYFFFFFFFFELFSVSAVAFVKDVIVSLIKGIRLPRSVVMIGWFQARW